MTHDLTKPFQARYWQRLPDGLIQCEVCPRACRLKTGARGACFVRARHNDHMVLTTYGRCSGICIDPIEKKPLYHFLPGTPVLSFGTAGCNLTCKFCQNWDISRAASLEAVTDLALPHQLVQAAIENDCQSVALTYNDPVIFAEYAIDTAKLCLQEGIKTVAVTNGYVWKEARRDLFACISAANIDLKAFSERFYRDLCAGHIAHVLDTLKYLKRETEVWIEITTLLIPKQNDSEEEIRSLCKWILENLGADVPLHFSAFHPAYQMQDLPPTPPETVKFARNIAREMGLHHVYTGNIHDLEGSTTYCSNCGKAVIIRDWYEITAYWLTGEGNCQFCKAKCPGIFDGPCGAWGAKRKPVYLRS